MEKALEPRAHISELSRLPGQGKGTARSLPVPGAGCPRVQGTVPFSEPHSLQGSQKHFGFMPALELDLAPQQLEEDSPGGDRDATSTVLHCASSPVEISSEEEEGLQICCPQARSAQFPRTALGEAAPPPKTSSLTHG